MSSRSSSHPPSRQTCCRALYSGHTSDHRSPELYSLYSIIQRCILTAIQLIHYTALYNHPLITATFTTTTVTSTINYKCSPGGSNSRTERQFRHDPHRHRDASLESGRPTLEAERTMANAAMRMPQAQSDNAPIKHHSNAMYCQNVRLY